MHRIRSIIFVAAIATVLPAAAPLAAPHGPTGEGWDLPADWEEPVYVALPEEARGLGTAADLYAWDPLGLVAGDDVRKYSLGVDSWEVWICNTPNGDQALNPNDAAAYLNANAGAYFDFLSEGRYDIQFQAGGTVVASDEDANECLQLASQSSSGGVEAAMVIVNSQTGFGFGGPGLTCPTVVCGNQGPTTYPNNSREIFVGAEAVMAVGGFSEPLESLPTHEVGHTLHWSHSFTGDEVVNGRIWEYDNPIDVMSGNGSSLGGPSIEPDSYGTVGLNRYAAGWVDPEDVYVHRGGTQEVVLHATGSNATELAIVSLGTQGRFVALDTRIRSSQDPIPTGWQGVALHEVDQRPIDHFPDDNQGPCFSASYGACIGAERRILQNGSSPYQINHVLTPGESQTVAGVKITVLAKEGDAYRVRFAGNPGGGARFDDIAGSVFEADIEWLADSGITKGCNPPSNTLFCPDDRVTRGQMAAFLVRALGLSDTGSQTFSDTVGHVFAADIAKLAKAGITKGCNPPANTLFCPDNRVTRGQMAAFLTRAFGLTDGSGVSFSDTASSEFAADIAKLAKAGITKGCNPPTNSLFCPHDSVTRGQMAAFLHRSESYLP